MNKKTERTYHLNVCLLKHLFENLVRNNDVFHNGNGFIQSLSFFNVNSNPNLDFRPHNYGQFLSWFNDNSVIRSS